MKILQDQKSNSKDIIKKIINKAAKETNDEIRTYLDELKKIKNEIASSASK